MRRAWQLSAIALVLAAVLRAQEQLAIDGPSPPTVQVGDYSLLTIQIEGESARPRPPTLPEVDGLTLQLFGPSHETRTSIVNGRRSTRVTATFQVRILPRRPGEFVLPSFPIWTGTKEQLVPETSLSVVELREGALGWIDVRLHSRRVYVHEPIRMVVELGIQPGLRLAQEWLPDRRRVLDVSVQAPWVQRFPNGELIGLVNPPGDSRMVLVNDRVPAQASYEASHERDGQRWSRFTLGLHYLPVKPGTVELAAPTLRFSVVENTGRRDVFNRPLVETKNHHAFGEPVTIEVLPIPEEGRPTPYYGAVGRFRIAAALDRDQVTVGNSVKLQLTVTGQGNLEYLRLPELVDLEGFHLLGEAEAQRDADQVVVTYDLAPLSTDVAAVPAIAWNYFDTTPGVERFVEVATAPLPLSVRPLPNGETLAPLPNADAEAVTPGVDDIYDLPALDGAPHRRAGPAPLWSWAALLGPWLLVIVAGVALGAMRRRAADVAGQRARGALRSCRSALAAGDDPVDALAAYLGDRFDVPAAAVIRPDLRARLLRAGVPEALADQVAAAIDRGTAARYGGGAPLTAQEVEALAQQLEPARLQRGAFSALWLLPLLAALSAAPLPAQQSAADEAVAAYRSGDYAAADAAFASAFDATGDRRLLRARGNCLFRLGDLPRALWAYESARLGTPRDPELLADIALVRARLELAPREAGFVAELRALQRRLTLGEQQALLAACMLLAAGCLVAGWRRVGLRWVGVIALIPGLWLAAELCWLGPQRPPVAIALEKVAITSEPRADLPPVATARAGVELELLGGTGGDYARVRVGERSGYVATAALAVVE